MNIEVKPEVKANNELPKEDLELQPMDTSEAKSELVEIKSDSEKQQQKKENTENTEQSHQPRQRKKRKKGKKIVRAKDYPKYYQNAYVRYCNEIRPKVCSNHPELDPVEVTKLVANMWYGLPKEEKQPYLDKAKVDKDRFKKELQEFKLLNPGGGSDREKLIEKEKPPKKKKSRQGAKLTAKSPIISEVHMQSTPSSIIPKSEIYPLPSTSKQLTMPQTSLKKDDELPRTFFIGMDCELPIFTDAFLEHNKTIEGELKILRKNNIEMEQQNSVLLKHKENLEIGLSKVETEISHTRKKNTQLEVYLTKLRCLLAANFHSLSLPGSKGGATVENIDKYMTDLAHEAKKSHSSVATKARDILKNVDLKIAP